MLNSSSTPFLLVLVAVGMYYTYVSPGYVEIQRLRAEEMQYTEALNRVREIQTLRDDLLARYNKINAEDIKKLETFLPDDVDNVQLVLDTSVIAEKYSIKMRNIKVTKFESEISGDPSIPQKPYNRLQMSFTFSATFEDVQKFMKEIEQSLQILDITALNLRPTLKLSGLDDYTMTFTTYWLK